MNTSNKTDRTELEQVLIIMAERQIRTHTHTHYTHHNMQNMAKGHNISKKKTNNSC